MYCFEGVICPFEYCIKKTEAAFVPETPTAVFYHNNLKLNIAFPKIKNWEGWGNRSVKNDLLFYTASSSVNDFILPSSYITDFILPSSYITDFILPSSYIADFILLSSL